MPYYKYVCENCGHVEELLCPISEKAAHEESMECERCHGRKFSPVFTQILVSGSHREIPQSTLPAPGQSGCANCGGGSCGSCGL